jgi:hypothetical protein
LTADKIAGSNPLTLLTLPSSHNSPKNKYSSIDFFSPYTNWRSQTAIATSKLVPLFLTSEGARLSIILCGGNSISLFLHADLNLSLASLIAASGNQIISIIGKALELSASTTTSYHFKPIVVYVFALTTMIISLLNNFSHLGYFVHRI